MLLTFGDMKHKVHMPVLCDPLSKQQYRVYQFCKLQIFLQQLHFVISFAFCGRQKTKKLFCFFSCCFFCCECFHSLFSFCKSTSIQLLLLQTWMKKNAHAHTLLLMFLFFQFANLQNCQLKSLKMLPISIWNE